MSVRVTKLNINQTENIYSTGIMKKVLLAFLLVFGLSAGSFAQQDVRTITLDKAVNIALENNYQLKIARNRVELADDRITGEKADFLPTLNARAGYRKSIGNQFIPGTSRFTTQSFSSYSASLSTNITLFSGFANIRSLRNARYNKRTRKQNAEWTKETIIFRTAKRFLQVLLDKELLQIAKENLQASLKTLEQVKAQVEVGARPVVDLYNQKATVANNRLTVTNRRNALELSRLALVSVLQIDPLGEYRFTIPEIDIEHINPKNYDLQRMIAVALENRSDLQSARFNIKALKWQLKTAKSRYWPSLSFGASISSRYLPGSKLSFSEQFFDFQISKGFGITLSIPIFNGLNTRTSVQRAKINYKNAKLQLQNKRLQVIQEVKQAYSDYQAILERLDATQAALKAAKKAYQAAKARYEVGAGTLIQLTQASANLQEAKSNRAQAVYNFIFQKKLLNYYLGKLDKNISFN